jgi:hypothetical protein
MFQSFSASARTRAPGAYAEDVTWGTVWATPLLVARQNLLLARSRVVEHRYSEAIPPLLTTAEALTFFEAEEIGRYNWLGGEAGYTQRHILEYAIGIETDNDNALRKIDSWLEQINEWNELRFWPTY